MKKCFVVRFEDMAKVEDLKVASSWPERNMSMQQLCSYSPSMSFGDIITENPWIISTFPRNRVYVLEGNAFTNPDFETFGASVNKIMMCILGRKYTIPDIALMKIEEFRNMEVNTEKEANKVIKMIYQELGDSVERVLLIKTLMDKF